MEINQNQYNDIIEHLVSKKVTIDAIIGHLHKNRLKFNEFNCVKTNESLKSEDKTTKVTFFFNSKILMV